MNERRNTTGFDRRTFLAGAAAACLAGAARGQENDPLQELIQRNQEEEFGQTFDAAANSMQMPTASLPTLSPATTQTTEAAVAQYEQTVARGGWPVVPPVQRLRVGMKHASVKPLRERLIIAGDLDGRSGLNDTYDTYVEAAVRGFQTRHGLSPDGMVREQTLRSLNVPATAVCRETATPPSTASIRASSWRPCRPRGSRRWKAALRSRGTPPSPASRIGPLPTFRARSSRSTSIRTGTCRSRSSART